MGETINFNPNTVRATLHRSCILDANRAYDLRFFNDEVAANNTLTYLQQVNPNADAKVESMRIELPSDSNNQEIYGFVISYLKE